MASRPLRLDQVACDLADRSAAAEGHGQIQLLTKDPEDTGYPRSAFTCKPPQDGTPYLNRAGSECHGLDYISAAANTAVHEHVEVASHRIGDRGKHVDGRRRRIELTA